MSVICNYTAKLSDKLAIEKHIKTQTFMFFVIIKASDLKGQLATNGLASIVKSFFVISLYVTMLYLYLQIALYKNEFSTCLTEVVRVVFLM